MYNVIRYVYLLDMDYNRQTAMLKSVNNVYANSKLHVYVSALDIYKMYHA